MQKTWEASDNISGAPAPGGDHGPLTHEKVNTQSTRNIKMRQHLCVVHALPRTRLTNAILYENSSQERHLEMKLTGNQDRPKTKLSALVAFIGLICSYFINFCLGLLVIFFYFGSCFALDVLMCPSPHLLFSELQRRKLRSSVAMEITKRAFTAQQDRKRRKWQREDQVRISSMNLPVFTERGQREMSGIGGGVGLVADRRPSMMTIYRLASDGGRAESTVQDRKPLLPMMKVSDVDTMVWCTYTSYKLRLCTGTSPFCCFP